MTQIAGRRGGGSLLDALQGLIERTYRMETGIRDIGRYVIGDLGYRLIYGLKAEPAASAGARPAAAREEIPASARPHDLAVPAAGSGARVLVREGRGPLQARIYYPDALIRQLEEDPPTRGVGDRNIDGFAVFIEELDHLLLIAERARLNRPVSLLELEIHANITKYLVCALFLASAGWPTRSRPLDAASRLWLRWHLFEKIEYAEEEPSAQGRYREALRFALRFIALLEREPTPRSRLERLRSFHDKSHQQKLAALA